MSKDSDEPSLGHILVIVGAELWPHQFHYIIVPIFVEI